MIWLISCVNGVMPVLYREGRTPSPGGHRGRQDRPRHQRARTGAPRAWACLEKREGSHECAHAPGCWFLVGGDDKFVLAQCLPLPSAPIQVQDPSGLGLELRIARKDPAAVLPGADCVLVQPAPDGACSSVPPIRVLGLPRHIGHTEPRQRQAQGGRELTGQRLDLNADLWGEKPGTDLGGLVPPGPPIAP